MDLPEVAKKIQVEETSERSPCSESLFQKIGSSLNYIQNNLQTLAVGSIESSFLTEAQYQAIRGTGFVLADGRNVAGSTYSIITGETTIPDLRGVMIRGKDHGRGLNPDGDLALGTYQDAIVREHNHGVNYSDGTSGSTAWWPWGGSPYLKAQDGTEQRNVTGPSSQYVSVTFIVLNRGVDSGHPKNMTCNWFIRIN